MIHQVRVIFGDTDQMGVVYYANYLRYFEGARAAYLRYRGKTNRDLQAWNVALPVIEAHCRYRSPAHYEDLLDIEVEISAAAGASLRFEYQARREQTLLAEGYTVHAAIRADTGRPCRIPAELRALIDSDRGE